MRAVVLRSHGGPECLTIEDVPDPAVGADEVLVDIVATALNRADLLQVMGLYPNPRPSALEIPGLEFAGTVAAIGEQVTLWKTGDAVMAIDAGGAYAQRIAVHERQLMAVPPSVRVRDAAAIPEVFLTAWDALVTQAFALLVFLVLLIVTRGVPPATLLWLPALAIPQLLLTLGISWTLSALGVYLRDLGQVIGFLLTICFFLTPICYPAESLPAWALPVLKLNPMFTLVDSYRAVLVRGDAPPLVALAILWIVAATVFLGGHAWFWRLRKTFADVI